MRKKFIVSVLTIAIVSSSGCAEMGSKEASGTGIGALAGAVIGSAIGKGNGKVAAVLVGAALGATIGNRVGHMLDEQDKQALALRTQEVLNQPSMASAQPISWASDHSGATAQITQGHEYTQTKNVEVKRAPKIQAVPSMKLINEPYLTTKSVNVRSAPDGKADKVGGLQSNTEFTAVGSTGDWILVGRKGVTVGYVNKQFVSPKTEVVAKNSKPAINLDDMNVAASKETQAFALDSIQSMPTQQVAAETSCRPVTVSLKAANGQTEQEQSTYCKQANGTWELI